MGSFFVAAERMRRRRLHRAPSEFFGRPVVILHNVNGQARVDLRVEALLVSVPEIP